MEDLFPSVCEEIGSYGYEYTRGCSDLIASNDVTEDGSVIAAHNNDTSVSTQERVTIIHYQVDGEPEIVAVGYGGLGISVGYNSAGISLTGNQVDSNDMRVGVPRFLLVRKILAAQRIGQAIDAAILKERASDYNQVITDANGEIYSIEGSATDYAPIYATDGYLVHTNHFVAPWMRKFELDPNAITGSIVRYNRGTRLLKNNLHKLDSREDERISVGPRELSGFHLSARGKSENHVFHHHQPQHAHACFWPKATRARSSTTSINSCPSDRKNLRRRLHLA